MTDSTGKFTEKRDEPLFVAIRERDAAFQRAYARAAATLTKFVDLLQSGSPAIYSAKLRFRDPDKSEQVGENRYLFLWLSDIHFSAAAGMFSGTFFEVPSEMQKWHQVGKRLKFRGEDIFDWMVLTEDGHLTGGYTLRVSRANLPEDERAQFDQYVGVKHWGVDA